jgi:glucokinase
MAGPSFIGVDLGGTNLRAGRVDASGAIVAIRRMATDAGGPQRVIGQIAELVTALREPDTAGVGIGIPGGFDPARGVVLGIPALPGWTELPLASLLAERTGLPCVLENDAKAACLGEWRQGAARGQTNAVYVTIGTGIGSAAIVEGRLLRGAGGLAGESGHMRVTDADARCACGLTGCWQAVASGTALDRAATASGVAGTRLADIAGGGAVTATHVGLGAREGDALCRALLAAHAEIIGVGLANLQHLYSPDLFVIGGGLSALLDLLLEGIATTLAARLLPGFRPAAIAAAALGDDAGVVGAAEVARASWQARS